MYVCIFILEDAFEHVLEDGVSGVLCRVVCVCLFV